MKRLIQRAAALTAALCLAAVCMAPVYAETANTEKEENVYVSLAGDGSVADIYIVNMFALDSKTEIRDYGAYSSVRNLTSEADISLDGDSVTVSAEAGTFYYQGNLKDAQLPWNISVAYMLDGKNVAADELAGANGHLVISGSVTKNKLADGDFYEAYMVQATVLLDTVKCRNIQTEGATEANVGADKQLSYMKLPGQDLSFTIETDVTDFSMEGISLNAVPLAIHMEKPDTSELDGQIDDLQDGAQQLDDGAKELAAGAQELNSGAAAVASGAASLVAGANTKRRSGRACGRNKRAVQRPVAAGGTERGAAKRRGHDFRFAPFCGQHAAGEPTDADRSQLYPNDARKLCRRFGGCTAADRRRGAESRNGRGPRKSDGRSDSCCTGTSGAAGNSGRPRTGGSSELAEGTGELRGRTSDMDSQLNDKIDELIDGFTGADYEICSFVSEKNTQVDAVQFVMTTPAIEEAEARRAPAQEAQTLSLWQRLLALFQ